MDNAERPCFHLPVGDAVLDARRPVGPISAGAARAGDGGEGTVYGTVEASAASGSPLTTTVTVTWDSGRLDSGLSAIATGIVTASAHSSLPGGS